jgi:RHS repeat-associated protein
VGRGGPVGCPRSERNEARGGMSAERASDFTNQKCLTLRDKTNKSPRDPSTSPCPRDYGGKGAEGMKKEIPSSNYGYRFYVPLLGRWINRDPIGEVADSTLYGFLANNPINSNDRYGLFDPRLMAAFGIIAIIEGILHQLIYRRSVEIFPHCPDKDIWKDKQRHCYVNCISTRVHIFHSAMAMLFSLGKEAWDLLIDGEGWESTARDMASNIYGQVQGSAFWDTCKDRCECPLGSTQKDCCPCP